MEESLFDTVMNVFMHALMAVMIMVCAILGLYGIYEGVNWLGVGQQETSGKISEISFYGAHTERRCAKTCHTEYVPDKWYLSITTRQGSDWMTINHAPWGWQQSGSSVSVTYERSRLDNKFSITSISAL